MDNLLAAAEEEEAAGATLVAMLAAAASGHKHRRKPHRCGAGQGRVTPACGCLLRALHACPPHLPTSSTPASACLAIQTPQCVVPSNPYNCGRPAIAGAGSSDSAATRMRDSSGSPVAGACLKAAPEQQQQEEGDPASPWLQSEMVDAGPRQDGRPRRQVQRRRWDTSPTPTTSSDDMMGDLSGPEGEVQGPGEQRQKVRRPKGEGKPRKRPAKRPTGGDGGDGEGGEGGEGEGGEGGEGGAGGAKPKRPPKRPRKYASNELTIDIFEAEVSRGGRGRGGCHWGSAALARRATAPPPAQHPRVLRALLWGSARARLVRVLTWSPAPSFPVRGCSTCAWTRPPGTWASARQPPSKRWGSRGEQGEQREQGRVCAAGALPRPRSVASSSDCPPACPHRSCPARRPSHPPGPLPRCARRAGHGPAQHLQVAQPHA